MYIFVVIVHLIVAIFLIAIVLLQTGKGADMGAVFGGSSQTLFGSVGPGSFLSKLTAGAAVIFMMSSLGLAYLSSRREGVSIMRNVKSAPAVPAPSTPVPVQTQPATPKTPVPVQQKAR